MSSFTISATDFKSATGSIVEDGFLLCDAVIDALSSYDRVFVSLVGMRGVTSSYFNAFFSRLAKNLRNHDAIGKIEPRFENELQRTIWDRSSKAFLK
jgi:hypothetical protein